MSQRRTAESRTTHSARLLSHLNQDTLYTTNHFPPQNCVCLNTRALGGGEGVRYYPALVFFWCTTLSLALTLSTCRGCNFAQLTAAGGRRWTSVRARFSWEQNFSSTLSSSSHCHAATTARSFSGHRWIFRGSIRDDKWFNLCGPYWCRIKGTAGLLLSVRFILQLSPRIDHHLLPPSLNSNFECLRRPRA